MPIALTTPILGPSVNDATAKYLRVVIPANDATPAVAMLGWVPCDAAGNATGAPVEVTLTAADVVAFFSTAGGWRPRMNAALISNQPQLTGIVT